MKRTLIDSRIAHFKHVNCIIGKIATSRYKHKGEMGRYLRVTDCTNRD